MGAWSPARPRERVARERVARALAEGRLLHLTHADCLDGMSCVGLVRRAFPHSQWVGIQPDETTQALEWIEAGLADSRLARARILVTDLSLGAAGGAARGHADDASIGRLVALTRHADVVWLDHHEPQWPKGLEDAVSATGVHVRVDRSGLECGATLTLDFLERLADAPLGTFRLAASPFRPADHAAMRAVAHRDTFSDPDDPYGIRLSLASRRLRRDYALFVEHGEYRALELLAQGPWSRRDRELAAALGRVVEQDGVATVFGPAPLSDLAHAYWREHPSARLLLHFTRDGKLRVRSRPGFPHAHRLARLHGGGGHAHAAGARLVRPGWRRSAYRALRRHDPKVRRVMRRARALAREDQPWLPSA